jgi:drug/metabolite transporter (DMT)-like permease
VTWIALSLLAGLADATVYAAMKKLRDIPPQVLLWWRFTLALPVLLGLLALDGWPTLEPGLLPVLLVFSVMIAVGALLIVKATQVAPLSTSMPVLSFTPAFLLVTSYLMLGEQSGPLGTVGVLTIVAGAYLLNVHQRSLGLLAPLKALFTDGGSLLVMGTALIYAITANLGKIGIERSSSAFFAAAAYVVVCAVVMPFMLRSTRGYGPALRAGIPYLLLMGVAAAVMMICYAVAVRLTIVPYVIALKRTNGLFSVLFGLVLFGEGRIKQSLLGAGIMFGGVLLIVLSG